MNAREIAELITLVDLTFIGLSGIALTVGVILIKRGQREAHRRAMLTATVLAALFLVLYVTKAIFFEAKVYAGPEEWKTAYLLLLFSHIVLAAANGPLALIAIRYALLGRSAAGKVLEGEGIRQGKAGLAFSSHKRWVRWLVPVWLYVVVTGWMIWAVLNVYGVYKDVPKELLGG